MARFVVEDSKNAPLYYLMVAEAVGCCYNKYMLNMKLTDLNGNVLADFPFPEVKCCTMFAPILCWGSRDWETSQNSCICKAPAPTVAYAPPKTVIGKFFARIPCCLQGTSYLQLTDATGVESIRLVSSPLQDLNTYFCCQSDSKCCSCERTKATGKFDRLIVGKDNEEKGSLHSYETAKRSCCCSMCSDRTFSRKLCLAMPADLPLHEKVMLIAAATYELRYRGMFTSNLNPCQSLINQRISELLEPISSEINHDFSIEFS